MGVLLLQNFVFGAAAASLAVALLVVVAPLAAAALLVVAPLVVVAPLAAAAASLVVEPLAVAVVAPLAVAADTSLAAAVPVSTWLVVVVGTYAHASSRYKKRICTSRNSFFKKNRKIKS